MENKTLISIQISQKEKALLEACSKARGFSSLSEFIRQGARMFTYFDPFLSGKAGEIGEQMGKPEAEIVRVGTLCYLADLAAEAELHEPRLLLEFAGLPAGMRTSEDIFERRKEDTKKKIEATRENLKELQRLRSKERG